MRRACSRSCAISPRLMQSPAKSCAANITMTASTGELLFIPQSCERARKADDIGGGMTVVQISDYLPPRPKSSQQNAILIAAQLAILLVMSTRSRRRKGFLILCRAGDFWAMTAGTQG
jgi:hypothetical protein